MIGLASIRWRLLLLVLGLSEILMASSARPGAGLIGLLGGVAVVAASACVHRRVRLAWSLLFVGTVPFAVVARTALVPELIVLVAGAMVVPVRREAVVRR